MERLILLVCLTLICGASAEGDTVLNPRGARPVEHATRGDKCATQKEWPFCTSDEWGPKCPSGCRIQGLMDKEDHSLLKKIEKIRNLLNQYKARHRNADDVSKQTFDYLKDKLTVDTGNDNNYYDLAQNLRRRITEMKIKIDRQLRILANLKDKVRDQVLDIQRLEVDIDMKLRSCKGSCKGYSEFSVDQQSYVSLEKQMNQLDNLASQGVESVGTLYVMKSRPLKDALVSDVYKSKDVGSVREEQKADMFPEVETVQFVLEEEGSSSSPATVSKDPGTSYSPSTSSSSSVSTSSSSTSSKSITELGGHGSGLFGKGGVFEGHSQPVTTHTSTTSCTKTIKTKVEITDDGPVEKTEEVFEGPGCGAGTDFGDLSSFFPTFGHTSSSSSSSSHSSSVSKTSHTSTKGSLLDLKGGFADPFGVHLADDDLPDAHARSVKSTRVERQADYVGKVCVRLKQQKQDGRRPRSHTRTYRTQHCRAKPGVGLCSDDDWVHKCPSGCRLQGLISQMEDEAETKLRKVCETAKVYEDAAEKTMKKMTNIYTKNRQAIINRHTSELKFMEQAEELARNLTSLRKRSSKLSRNLKELRQNVHKQIEDLYRAEVDIDMKLRACHGSCRSVSPFSVDHSSYQTLQADMDLMDKTLNRRRTAAAPPEDIPRIKLQPVDFDTAPSEEYKSIPAVQRELLTQFEDLGQNQVVLEELLDFNPAEFE